MNAVPLADRILRLSSNRVPLRQLDLAVTVIMLQPGGYNALLGYEGIRKRRYKIDHHFVSKILRATGDRRIVQSPAFASLPRLVYRRLFFRYWRLRCRDESWRLALGWSLGPFLRNVPGDGPIYAGPIWVLAKDSNEWVASRGIMAMQHLGTALTLEQCEALIAFTRDKSVRSGTSMSTLGSLYKDLERLRPEVRALLLAPATLARLRGATPHDGREKPSSYDWCVTQMRKAITRARRGRIPRLVK